MIWEVIPIYIYTYIDKACLNQEPSLLARLVGEETQARVRQRQRDWDLVPLVTQWIFLTNRENQIMTLRVSDWQSASNLDTADISYHRNHRRWCTFSNQCTFKDRGRAILAYFGYLVANLRTFWCTFTGLNNALVYQNWLIWGMNLDSICIFCYVFIHSYWFFVVL